MANPEDPRKPVSRATLPASARTLGAVMGLVLCGIGLTVIGHLWTERGFEEPPLFFKLFGSLVAIPFVAIGGTMLASVVRGTGPELTRRGLRSPGPPSDEATGAGYVCPGCGARLGQDAEVSPKGDVKCGYCRQWFNIHG